MFLLMLGVTCVLAWLICDELDEYEAGLMEPEEEPELKGPYDQAAEMPAAKLTRGEERFGRRCSRP
jgi:hypothetical protein